MNLICDLDGVVYRGDTGVPGSAEALQRAEKAGMTLWFVTNNSSRTPEEVCAKLQRLMGLAVPRRSILTSSQAAARMVEQDDFPVYVFGSAAIDEALTEGSVPITTDPHAARTVVIGLDRRLSYERLSNACEAVFSGARLIATNIDPTYPVNDGLLPGCGAIVAAVERATGVTAEVAGKPHPPMRALIREMGIGEAWIIGDRLDTDLALAATEEDWRGLLVLTGVTSEAEAHAGDTDGVFPDLAAAVDHLLADSGLG